MSNVDLKSLIPEIVELASSGGKRRFRVSPPIHGNQSEYWIQNIVAGSKEEALQIANSNQPDNPATLSGVEEIPINFLKQRTSSVDQIDKIEAGMTAREKRLQAYEKQFGHFLDQYEKGTESDLDRLRSIDNALRGSLKEDSYYDDEQQMIRSAQAAIDRGEDAENILKDFKSIYGYEPVLREPRGSQKKVDYIRFYEIGLQNTTEAQKYGLVRFKSGRYGLPVFKNSDKEATKRSIEFLDKQFGHGKDWRPTKR